MIKRFGRRPLLIEALPAAERTHAVFANGQALLLITDCDNRSTSDVARLRMTFGLSDSEARLAVLLSSGKTLAQAADALEVTYETARTQLKSVFAKSGTRRQAELVDLLSRVGFLSSDGFTE